MTTTSLDPRAVRSALDRSAVLAPDDDGYEDARTIAPGGIDWRPTAIVRPTDAAGVAQAVRFARDADVELAVRAGGHSVFGLGRADGALTIDLRGLTSLEIADDGRSAWAGGGITAGAYTAAVGERGLATPFGDTATVGVGGLTLGGGVGFLSRSRGMTIDNLLAAEVVTADGEVLVADAEQHPDLFWALRGGGGNLGVVTRFRYELQELPSVVGGVLILPATPESVAGIIAAADAAPRELTAILMVMSAPPMPFIPAEWHGRIIVMANVCWSGAPEAADAALAPLRDVAGAAGGAIIDGIHPGPYAGLFEGGPAGHMIAVGRPFFADGVDTAAATHVIEQLESSDALMRAVQVRVLGGAVADVPDDATAYAHRGARILGSVAAVAPTVEAARGYTPFVVDLADRLRDGREGAYANFVSDADPALAAAAYPGATGQRLAAVKRQYDPQNVFRGNLNVAPA